MGELIALNRRLRRARYAQARREERAEHRHNCLVTSDLTRRAGGPIELRIDPRLYHDVHRVLGEPSCPRCPSCRAARVAGRIDRMPGRELVLALWRRAILEQLTP